MIAGYRLLIFASDVAATRAFYEERVGFAVEELEDGGFLLRRDGVEIALEGGARARRRGRRWVEEAGVLVSLTTDDFEALTAELGERGVVFLGEVVTGDDGKRVTGFADPDGNLFEIQEV